MSNEIQRQMAKDLFNRVWDLLEQEDRTPEDDDTMLQAAYASRFHWGEVGEPVNWARGEWQISRVNSVLGRVDAAYYHARRCLELCQENALSAFDEGYAYEALARAAALAGEVVEAERYRNEGRRLAEDIADEDERVLLLADLDDLAKDPS